jgi:hypothetical protein
MSCPHFSPTPTFHMERTPPTAPTTQPPSIQTPENKRRTGARLTGTANN